MEKNSEFTQIYINKRLSNLKGKVIDKVFLAQDPMYYDMNELLIIFTDKTYVAIGIDDVAPDNEEAKYVINDTFVCAPASYNSGHFRTSSFNGELYFTDEIIENRVKSGIWKVTPEECQKLIAEYERRRDEQDYKRYLFLKNKFEGREDEFKDVKI